MDNEEENKKPSRKKKASPKKPLLNSDDLRNILRDALLSTSKEKLKTNSQLEIEAMVATMEEFLKAFIVIGYDFSEEPVFIVNAKSQLDADALSSSLTRIFLNGGGGSSNIPPPRY